MNSRHEMLALRKELLQVCATAERYELRARLDELGARTSGVNGLAAIALEGSRWLSGEFGMGSAGATGKLGQVLRVLKSPLVKSAATALLLPALRSGRLRWILALGGAAAAAFVLLQNRRGGREPEQEELF